MANSFKLNIIIIYNLWYIILNYVINIAMFTKENRESSEHLIKKVGF